MGGRFWGTVGSNRPVFADLKKFIKPDDFNDIDIKCVRSHVTVMVNGLTTLDAVLVLRPGCHRRAAVGQ
jgi:hypothetical protein